jgi:hypothetical protein
VELRGFEPLTSAARLQRSPNRLMFERPSNLALCSDAGQTSKARSGGRHFDLRPGAEDGDSRKYHHYSDTLLVLQNQTDRFEKINFDAIPC